MSAGLPGLGLGGLFFIFSALLAPGPELWRTLRGGSSLAAWRIVGRQFAQALAMIAGVDLTIRLVYLGLAGSGVRDAPAADGGTVLPLTLIGITSALLIALLVAAKLAELALRARSAQFPRAAESLPRAAPVRVLSFAGVAGLAWVALLAVGASELSPLGRPVESSPTERPAERVLRSPTAPAADPVRRVAGLPTAAPADGPSAEARQLAAGADREKKGDDARAPLPEPPPKAQPLPAAPTAKPQKPSPAAAAPAALAPSPVPAKPTRGTPPATKPSEAGGPPSTAGPPEGSPAPDHAGPPEHAAPPGQTRTSLGELSSEGR